MAVGQKAGALLWLKRPQGRYEEQGANKTDQYTMHPTISLDQGFQYTLLQDTHIHLKPHDSTFRENVLSILSHFW
jgi:hypothetical protein